MTDTADDIPAGIESAAFDAGHLDRAGPRSTASDGFSSAAALQSNSWSWRRGGST
jgi:hypothetical protein